jgi:beta-galactosidase
MHRRDFLKTTSTVIAGATLAPGTLSGHPPLPGASPANTDGRMVFPINRNWRYNRSFVEGAHSREFDDSGFERVVVPHTNVRLPWHSFDDKQYEFVSIYRRRFRLPPEARGRRVFVDFEGVMTASTVWINGVKLGEYKGGYTPF